MPVLGFTTEKVICVGNEKKIAVVSIGGCGGNIQSHIIRSKLPQASYLAIDSDPMALEKRTGVARIPLKKMNVAGQELNEIKKVLECFDYVFLLAGLGGETGGKVLSTILSAEDNFEAELIPIVTMPFSFEGHKRTDIAISAMDKIIEKPGIYGVLYNDKFMAVSASETGLQDMLIDCSKTVTSMLQLLLRILPLEEDTMFGLSYGVWRFEHHGVDVAKVSLKR